MINFRLPKVQTRSSIADARPVDGTIDFRLQIDRRNEIILETRFKVFHIPTAVHDSQDTVYTRRRCSFASITNDFFTLESPANCVCVCVDVCVRVRVQ